MLLRHFDCSIKVILVGDSTVNKSLSLLHLLRDTSVAPSGVDFMTQVITTDRHRIQLQLWDVPCQDRYGLANAGYCRGSDGAILFFDLADRTSFTKASQWLRDIRTASRSDVFAVLIGSRPEHRVIGFDEATAFARAHALRYIEPTGDTAGDLRDAVSACLDVVQARLLADSPIRPLLDPPRRGCAC
jgi:hypothetical protein